MSAADHLRHAHTRTLVLKADRAALTSTATLTTGDEDLQGDIVVPTGGRWPASVPVNFDHNQHLRIGTGTVEMVKGLPVGTTHYTRGDELAETVFLYVAEGLMPGVSIEFEGIEKSDRGFMCRRVPTPRRACVYKSWSLSGWAHTPMPINLSARAVEKAVRLIETRRLGDHRVPEALYPVLCKSFAPLLPRRTATVTVPRTVGKAMNPEDDDLDPMGMCDAPPMDEPPPVADEPPPIDEPATEAADGPAEEITELYDGAQQALDMADRFAAIGRKTLDDKLSKKFLKLAEELKTYAADFQADAEALEAKLAGRDSGVAAGPADDSGNDETMPVDESGADEPADDDDDRPKSYRPLTRRPDGALVTKSGYVPRRFRPEGGKPVAKSHPSDEADARALLAEFRAAIEDEKAREARASRRLRTTRR